MFQRLFLLSMALMIAAKPHPFTPSPPVESGQGVRFQSAPVVIHFWHPYADERGEMLETLVQEFNAAQAGVIAVEIIAFSGYSTQQETMLMALVNGGLPNVALIRNDDAALYQMSGALADLKPYVAQSSLQADDFYSLIWQQDFYAGQQLGIPLTRAYPALYVNMDALRELGYEAPPLSRAEFGSMACDFGEDGWSGYDGFDAVGYDIPLRADFFLTLVQPMDYFENDRFNFDAPPMHRMIDFLQVQLSNGCAGLPTVTAQESQNRFASGRTLFYVDSSDARSFVEEAVRSYFAEPFDLVVIPVPGEHEQIVNLSGYSLSLFQQNEMLDQAAWQFIEWMAQPQQVERWAAATHSIPARSDGAFDNVALQDALWMTEPNFPGYALVRDEIVFTIRGILTGGLEISEQLAALEGLANQIYAVFVLE